MITKKKTEESTEVSFSPFPTKEEVRQIRVRYPVGTRVKLIRMVDVQAPPIGTLGTVKGVDDAGSLLMCWDNGSGLNAVFGEDIVVKVK